MRRLAAATAALTLLSACSNEPIQRAQPHPEATPTAASPADTVAPPRSTPDQPEELGAVTWRRDFEAARASSRASGKPMFVLFTEVPGCSTVKGFADEVLRHPLVVEAIEDHFTPVAVYNNTSGDADHAILRSFGERAWNNPVVRIISPDRDVLAPRFSGPYDVPTLTAAMTRALATAERPTPGYLELLDLEGSAATRGAEKATFAMGCFWSGEAELGGLDGVVSSRTGFAQGREVVELEYDPRVTSERALSSQYGRDTLSGDTTLTTSPKDDKYRLRHTPWRFVPMTSTQASRVNAALGASQDPSAHLSPRQRGLFDVVSAHPDTAWPLADPAADLTDMWDRTEALAASLRASGDDPGRK